MLEVLFVLVGGVVMFLGCLGFLFGLVWVVRSIQDWCADVGRRA